MRYGKVSKGLFVGRPNRFVADVDLGGIRERVHVKNTGRCKELLVPGAVVYLHAATGPNRTTRYDLIAVEKKGRLINIDSGAPNSVFLEFLQSGSYLEAVSLIKSEVRYGSSRFDFYVEEGEKRIFLEVKGVSLEENGVVLFPDAPSRRGVKHVEELARSISEGYQARIIFVAQMRGALYFAPHRRMHPAFADALVRAKQAGVGIEAYDCFVAPDSLTLAGALEVRLA